MTETSYSKMNRALFTGFIIFSTLFTFLIVAHEWFLFAFEDQALFSSGDVTIRQTWLSIAIGYSWLISAWLILRRLIVKGMHSVLKWAAAPLLFIMFFCYWKNTQCIVYSSAFGHVHESYFPFQMPQVARKGMDYSPYDPLTCDSITLVNGTFNFYVHESGDVYTIQDKFLFWEYEERKKYLLDNGTSNN